ncbi:MAG: hypothetical protein WAX77_00350 [Methylococcaceae bacterium]
MSVNIPAKTEIQASNNTIASLKDYQSKNWAIGLTGDTLQPDSFLAFFTERSLPFLYYVRSPQGVNVGDSTAYQKDIDTLNGYIASIRATETAQVNATITNLNSYKASNWAIGLNGDTLLPDGFVTFFAVRSLPFAFYVRSHGLSLGDASAYDTNIHTLQNYLASL